MVEHGQGKSWLGLKFAFAGALQGERVGIYSGEMSKLQLQERILCCAKQSYLDTKEDSLKFIKDRDLCIRVLTPNELRRRANVNDIEEMIVRDKLTMVVVDQLSLMEDVTPGRGAPLRIQYGNISGDLFRLSQQHGLPAILLAQSNRQGSTDPNGPQIEHLSESDAVAQNSTRVLTMKNEMGILTMNIVKNRYGETGLTQRYEVDYGINKYKPLKDNSFNLMNNTAPAMKTKPKDIFGKKGI